MKKCIIILFIIFFIMHICVGQEIGDENLIAVLDFKLSEGIDPSLSRALADKMSEAILELKNSSIVDRNEIETILEEQNFQLSGLASEKEAVRIGEILGARLITSNAIVFLDDVYYISLKIIDVETSKILSVRTHTFKGTSDELFNVVYSLTIELFEGIREEQITTFDKVWRSSLLPGWGQLAAGYKLKGVIFMSSNVSLLSSIGLTGYWFHNKYDIYSTTEGYNEDYDALWQDVETSRAGFYITCAMYTAFYIYNIVDAVIFSDIK